MITNIEGIVLNIKNYGDTSLILDILTADRGIIGVMAKGCKSLKSNLRSVTDKLTYATFTIYYKKDKLSILSEATVINNFSNIKKDIEKISYASFLLDLTYQVYKQCENNDLYNLLEASIYENPPLSIKEGYLIKDGYNKELDELKSIVLYVVLKM